MILELWQHEPEEKFTHLRRLWNIASVGSGQVFRLHLIYQKSPEMELEHSALVKFARLNQKTGW